MFVAIFCSKEWSLELLTVKVSHHWTWLLRTDYLMLIFAIRVSVVLLCSLSTKLMLLSF